ncbi:MAG: hypothetical protein ABFD52_01520 [Acidobacteriota bacterium]
MRDSNRAYFSRFAAVLLAAGGLALLAAGAGPFLTRPPGQAVEYAQADLLDKNASFPKTLVLSLGDEPGVHLQAGRAVALFDSLGFAIKPHAPQRMMLGPGPILGGRPSLLAVGTASKG